MMVAPMSQRFVDAFARFVETHGIDLVMFEKGQRKDDIGQQYLATFAGDEGVLFVGKAFGSGSCAIMSRSATGAIPTPIRQAR